MRVDARRSGRVRPFGSCVAYWPEFAAAGKDNVLVRHLLSHTAGLPDWPGRLVADDLYDWTAVTDLLASLPTQWEPGTAAGYHSVTFGFLVGEVVRRVSGRTIGRFLAEEVAGPLGADFHIGLDAADDARVARLYPPPSYTDDFNSAGPDDARRAGSGSRTPTPRRGGVPRSRRRTASAPRGHRAHPVRPQQRRRGRGSAAAVGEGLRAGVARGVHRGGPRTGRSRRPTARASGSSATPSAGVAGADRW